MTDRMKPDDAMVDLGNEIALLRALVRYEPGREFTLGESAVAGLETQLTRMAELWSEAMEGMKTA